MKKKCKKRPPFLECTLAFRWYLENPDYVFGVLTNKEKRVLQQGWVDENGVLKWVDVPFKIGKDE